MRVAETASPHGTGVHVNVIVRDRTVMMRAGRDVQRASKRPEADGDERDADDPLTPR